MTHKTMTQAHPLTLPQKVGYDSPVASCKDVTGFDSLNGAAKSRDTDNSERGFFMPESHTSVRPQQAHRQFGGPDEEAERLAGAPSVCQPRSGCLPFDGGKAALQTVNGARAMSQNQLVTVAFNGQAILAILVDGKPFVAMKPIIENIGLQWEAQYKRILRHPVLNGSMSMMDIQVDGDVQRRQYLCLPLSMLNGWLFGVDVNRVKEEIKPKLVQYQRECFDVLAKHFLPAQRPHNPAIDYDRISPAQAQDLKELVRHIVDTKVQGFAETWSRLQRKFRVNSYLELPAARFDDARAYLLAKLPSGAQPLAPAPEARQRLQQAFAMATEAGAHVQRALFDTLVDGVDFKHHRVVTALTLDRDGHTTVPWALAIPDDAMIVSLDDLPSRIDHNDVHVTDLQLSRIAMSVAAKQNARAQARQAA